MMGAMKSFAPYLACAAVVWLAFAAIGRADEINVQQDFDVSIYACFADGRCAHCKTHVDAGNEVACMTSVGMRRAIMWAQEHCGWTLGEWRCAKPGKANI